MKKKVLKITLLLAITAAFWTVSVHQAKAENFWQRIYKTLFHPQPEKKRAGYCPTCHLKVISVREDIK